MHQQFFLIRFGFMISLFIIPLCVNEQPSFSMILLQTNQKVNFNNSEDGGDLRFGKIAIDYQLLH